MGLRSCPACSLGGFASWFLYQQKKMDLFVGLVFLVLLRINLYSCFSLMDWQIATHYYVHSCLAGGFCNHVLQVSIASTFCVGSHVLKLIIILTPTFFKPKCSSKNIGKIERNIRFKQSVSFFFPLKLCGLNGKKQGTRQNNKQKKPETRNKAWKQK